MALEAVVLLLLVAVELTLVDYRRVIVCLLEPNSVDGWRRKLQVVLPNLPRKSYSHSVMSSVHRCLSQYPLGSSLGLLSVTKVLP